MSTTEKEVVKSFVQAVKDLMENEIAIVENEITIVKNKITISETNKGECQDFKFDLIAKRNQQVIALIEAKYRDKSERPTTDALIAGFWKLLWEWGEKYCFSPEVKLIILIFVKDGESLGINVSTFRNNIWDKFKCFGRKFCNREIPLYFLTIAADSDGRNIKFNEKNLEEFLQLLG